MTERREQVVLKPSSELDEAQVVALFATAWPEGTSFSFAAAREHSLCWVSAHVGEQLVGFVNVAWDGAAHAFLLDTTVHPDFRRCGIGTALVRCAVDEARQLGARLLHVDYAAAHAGFYRRCGFRSTQAGLLELGAPAGAEPARWALRRYEARDEPECRAILASLSDWFAESAVAAYLADLPRTLTWVAVEPATQRHLGLLSLTRPQPRAFEVHLLAVAQDRHGQGVGRFLLELGERFATAQGARFMQVKTLAPSPGDDAYEKTRTFYTRRGYEALFESERLWEGSSRALVLVKALG